MDIIGTCRLRSMNVTKGEKKIGKKRRLKSSRASIPVPCKERMKPHRKQRRLSSKDVVQRTEEESSDSSLERMRMFYRLDADDIYKYGKTALMESCTRLSVQTGDPSTREPTRKRSQPIENISPDESAASNEINLANGKDIVTVRDSFRLAGREANGILRSDDDDECSLGTPDVVEIKTEIVEPGQEIEHTESFDGEYKQQSDVLINSDGSDRLDLSLESEDEKIDSPFKIRKIDIKDLSEKHASVIEERNERQNVYKECAGMERTTGFSRKVYNYPSSRKLRHHQDNDVEKDIYLVWKMDMSHLYKYQPDFSHLKTQGWKYKIQLVAKAVVPMQDYLLITVIFMMSAVRTRSSTKQKGKKVSQRVLTNSYVPSWDSSCTL